MTPKKVDVRSVPRDEFRGRWKNAQERLAAMERELAAGLWDPGLVLAIQAAIAAADALTIFTRGERSAAGRHFDAITVLERVTDVPGIGEARKHLARLLDRKSAIEYSGEGIKKDEAEALAEQARRFVRFVGKALPVGP